MLICLPIASSYISTAKDIILAISATIGAAVAIIGLSTWQRQLAGGVEYDLARRVLKNVYRIREGFNIVRFPVWQHNSEPDLPKEKLDKLTPEQRNWMALAQAHEKKWKNIADPKADLFADLLEVEVLWGREAREVFKPLLDRTMELLFAIENHLERMKPDAYKGDFSKEEINKDRDIMFSKGDRKKDLFLESIESAIIAIENIMKPKIRKK